MPAASGGDFIGCTVASRGFLAHARVLVDSFFEHHPSGRFAVLIPDDPGEECSMDERVEVLRPQDVGLDGPELSRRALSYSVKELSCSMKAPLMRHLVRRGDTAVLLDGDVCVYADLSPIAAMAARAGLVLSAHSVTPHATPGNYPPMIGHAPRMLNALGADQMLILAGTFNTGLLAATAEAVPFLDWWSERTARYCLLEPGRGLFQEQGWTALAPTLFSCHVLREPGWNVSGFHLHDEDVTWHDGEPRIAGAPLRCFHFITLDASDPERLSREDQISGVWPDPADRPGAVRVCREYAARLRDAGLDALAGETSPYDALPDGTPIDRQMRTAYGEALLEHEHRGAPRPPNPFEDGDSEAFLRWLEEPAEPGGEPPVSRYLQAIHNRLPWVWGSFKDVPGADAERYLGWLPEAVLCGDLDIPERWLPERLPYDSRVAPIVAELEARCAELEAHRSALQDVIDSVRASRSWRLTAPLRSMGALARRRA